MGGLDFTGVTWDGMVGWWYLCCIYGKLGSYGLGCTFGAGFAYDAYEHEE